MANFEPRPGQNDKKPLERHSVYDARSRHTELATPDSLFCDTRPRREDLCGRAFVLHGLLSPEEARFEGPFRITGAC